jgi:hypothetical protein
MRLGVQIYSTFKLSGSFWMQKADGAESIKKNFRLERDRRRLRHEAQMSYTAFVFSGFFRCFHAKLRTNFQSGQSSNNDNSVSR